MGELKQMKPNPTIEELKEANEKKLADVRSQLEMAQKQYNQIRNIIADLTIELRAQERIKEMLG